VILRSGSTTQQARQMLFKPFVLTARYGGVHQCGFYPSEIACKRWPRQSAHVFEYKGAWTQIANSPDGLRPHVSRIIMTTMFATDREWLTRWSARYEVHLSSEGSPIDFAHILASNGPSSRVFEVVRLVQAQRGESISIPFHHQLVIEPGSCRTQGYRNR